MNYLSLILGIGLILAVISDLVYTTFSPNGAGFFTNIITKGVYGFFREISIKTGYEKLFENAGVFIVVSVLAFWYISVWLGSSLIICSDPDSVINSSTKLPASIAEKIYYTGFTLSTLGVGDFKANSDVWRIFTVLLSFTGFVLITTGISYMLPVLSATVAKRRLGSYIATLGTSPQNILQKQWQDGNFKALESHFDNIAEMILQHSQQLLAYPVIYCFYSSNPRKSAALNIARLDETLTILLTNVPSDNRPGEQSIYPLREAITDYLVIQQKYFIDLEPPEPVFPELDELKKAGIPLVHEQNALKEIYKDFTDRRKLLGSILRDQGRGFKDIYQEDRDNEITL